MRHVIIDIVDGVFVVKPKETVSGRWGAEEVGEVRQVLDDVASAGAFDVVVSLRGLTILDSFIWGVLISRQEKLNSSGRRLALCDLSRVLRDSSGKIPFHFDVYRGIEEAVAGLRTKAQSGPKGQDAAAEDSGENVSKREAGASRPDPEHAHHDS